MADQCGVVPAMADRWHHRVLLSPMVAYPKRVLHSTGETKVNQFGYINHLDHLMSGNRKTKKTEIYNNLEI